MDRASINIRAWLGAITGFMWLCSICAVIFHLAIINSERREERRQHLQMVGDLLSAQTKMFSELENLKREWGK